MQCVRAFALIGLLEIMATCHAQTSFEYITPADDLPGNEVLSLFEDRRGYMWAGTSTGLARIEGTRVRSFHHDRNDSTSLAHDQVNYLAEDASGRLWIATMAGLCRYDPLHGNFTTYRVAADGNAAHQSNRMRQLLCVGDSLIWVVSEEGLYRFDPRTGSFHAENKPLAGEAPPGRVRARGSILWDAHRNGMWAASSNGLSFWNATSDHWTDSRNASVNEPWFNDRFMAAPSLQGRDTLWCFDERAYVLEAWHLTTGAHSVIDSLDGTSNHFTMKWQEVDPDGRHWVSLWTHRLLYRDPGSHWQEVMPSSAPAALRSGKVATGLRTRNGERWFATDVGIALLRTANAALQVQEVPGNSGTITELLSWGADTLLIGTNGHGVFRMDLGNGHVTNARFDRPITPDKEIYWGNWILDLSRRDTQSAWVATADGPAVLDVENMRIADATEFGSPPDPAGRTNVTFMRPDDHGRVWLGTWNRGLYVFDAATHTTQRTDTSGGPFGRVANRMMLSYLADRKGRCWIGMNNGGGLACLENDRLRAIRDADGGNLGGVVRCMAEAPDGAIWLGTHEEGIVVYDPFAGSARYLNRTNGLPGVRIGNILFDRAGTAWVLTAQGLARMLKDAAGFTPMTLPDGLNPLDLTGALQELRDGRIAFAVGKYLVFYDPRNDRSSTIAPRAVLTSVRINDSVYRDSVPPDALRLKPDQKAITLELGAIGLAPRSIPVFRYRIAGTDNGWDLIGTSQRIDLFDLPTGDHRIEVQASANGVDWSNTPATIDLVVLPPFWATWWFRLGAISVVVAAMLIGFRLYLRERLRKERTRFEREQAVLNERVRIAGDMHDDLGAGLSALKLKSEMALRVEKDPQKREQLGALADTAGELIGSMRQIIWTMNGDQATVEDLVVYTTSYVRNYCEQNELGADVKVLGPWPSVQLSTEQRRNVFLVVKEALHNVVKHAHANQVRVVMEWRDGLWVEVADDGVGLMRDAQGGQGNGLRNMEKRISVLGGSFTVDGSENGTSIRFQVNFTSTPNQGSIVLHQER